MLGYKKIRAIYSDRSAIVREKAVSLLILDTFVAFGFTVLGIIRIVTGSFLMGGLEIVVGIVLGLFVLLLLKKRFRIVSTGNVILFGLAAAGLFFLRDITNPNDVYIQATYMIPVFITAPLLAYAIWQVMGLIVFGLAVQSAQFFLRIKPALIEAGIPVPLTEYLVSLMLMVFGAVFVFQIFRMQQNSLRAIQSQAEESNAQYGKLKQLMESTGTAFNVGEKLRENAEQNRQIAVSISSSLDEVIESLSFFQQNIAAAADSGKKVESAKESVKTSFAKLSGAVSDSSSATEEISAQVGTMRNSAVEKQSVIDDLVNASEQGADELHETIESFRNISRNSDNIIEVIDVIESIADRTDMLAMNAAIEAAHAGEAGKGFAVVAEEIRKLAVESNENANMIRDTLQQSNNLIQSSVKRSEHLRDVFSDIIGKITTVKEALLEIISGMKELASGHVLIEQSVEHLGNINTQVNSSLQEMEGDIGTNSKSISSIEEATSAIEEKINRVTKLAADIVTESENLKTVGEENIAQFETLSREMGNLHR